VLEPDEAHRFEYLEAVKETTTWNYSTKTFNFQYFFYF
jgi:hypothetical protein